MSMERRSPRGLSVLWRERERAVVRRAHRAILGGPPLEVLDRDAVLDSVQLLYDYGYSLEDIGTMFGVTREAVRQWFQQFGLDRHEGGGACLRLWDDDLACFVPVEPDEYRAAQRGATRESRMAKRAARRKEIVEAARRVYARVGRPVTLNEVAEEAGCSTANPSVTFAHLWREPGESYKEPLDRLFQTAGVPRCALGERRRQGEVA